MGGRRAPPEASDFLAIVPGCCEPRLPPHWAAESEAAGARVLCGLANRDAMLEAALEVVAELPSPACGRGAGDEGGHAGPPTQEAATPLVPDFLALGYCHLLVELIISRARYSSNLDEGGLRSAALAAAAAALVGDAESARRELQAAFDRLHETREYHYAVEPRLLDMTLLAQTTMGQSLRDELATREPRSLLVSGEVVERMAAAEPETLAALKKALTDDVVALVGGEFTELPLPLLGPEAILGQLCRGLAAYERHLGCRPTVFGRRPFGLIAALPQIVRRLGFTAAFHCTLDDGQFPVGSQSRIQWEGTDGTAIEALGCVPLDAAAAASFLLVAEKLAEAGKLDQTATLAFAHWPGRTSGWYDDLQRVASYSTVLGRFVTVDGYFGQSCWDSRHVAYKPDEYRSPYLRQDVAARQPDPISRRAALCSPPGGAGELRGTGDVDGGLWRRLARDRRGSRVGSRRIARKAAKRSDRHARRPIGRIGRTIAGRFCPLALRRQRDCRTGLLGGQSVELLRPLGRGGETRKGRGERRVRRGEGG